MIRSGSSRVSFRTGERVQRDVSQIGYAFALAIHLLATSWGCGDSRGPDVAADGMVQDRPAGRDSDADGLAHDELGHVQVVGDAGGLDDDRFQCNDPTLDSPLDLEDAQDAQPGPCPVAAGLPPWVARAAAEPETLIATCAGLSIAVSWVGDGTVRLRYGSDLAGPALPYAVPQWDGPLPMTVGLHGDRFAACTDRLVVEIAPGTCAVRVTDLEGAVLVEDDPAGGYGQGDAPDTWGLPHGRAGHP